MKQQRVGVKRISGDADVQYRDPADVTRRAQERASKYRDNRDELKR